MESQIVNSICEYLALRKVFFWRQNTAPAFDWKTNRFRAMPKYAKRGVPDIIVIKNGRFIGLEVKAKKGRLSEHQADFARECVRNGGEYIVARSVDDVQKAGL